MQPHAAFKLQELQRQCPPSAYLQFCVLVSERGGKQGNGIYLFFLKKACIPGEMQYLNVRVKHGYGLPVLEGCVELWCHHSNEAFGTDGDIHLVLRVLAWGELKTWLG